MTFLDTVSLCFVFLQRVHLSRVNIPHISFCSLIFASSTFNETMLFSVSWSNRTNSGTSSFSVPRILNPIVSIIALNGWRKTSLETAKGIEHTEWSCYCNGLLDRRLPRCHALDRNGIAHVQFNARRHGNWRSSKLGELSARRRKLSLSIRASLPRWYQEARQSHRRR